MLVSGDIIMFGWLDSIGHCEGRCCRSPLGMRKQLWQADVAAAQAAANERLQIIRIRVKVFLTRRAGAYGPSYLETKTACLRLAVFQAEDAVGGPTETNGQAERWSQDAAAAHQPLLKPRHRGAQSQSQASIRPPDGCDYQ